MNHHPLNLNARQHRFVINLLSGMSQTDAYINAGYNVSRDVAKVNASDLLTKPNVSSLYNSKRDKAMATVEAQVLSKAEKRTILATIARAQLAELLDDTGNIKFDKKNPSIKALKEWYHRERTDRDGNPIITKSIKLIDPIAAIIEDNKLMGDYAPSKHLVGHQVQFEVSFTPKGKELTEGTSLDESGQVET